jgi:hypothetical protein
MVDANVGAGSGSPFKAVQSELEFNKECKNSVRYDAVDPINGVTNAIYIPKKHFPQAYYPARIRVSVTEAE